MFYLKLPFMVLPSRKQWTLHTFSVPETVSLFQNWRKGSLYFVFVLIYTVCTFIYNTKSKHSISRKIMKPLFSQNTFTQIPKTIVISGRKLHRKNERQGLTINSKFVLSVFCSKLKRDKLSKISGPVSVHVSDRQREKYTALL